jgi:hypothetical protein
VGGVTKLLSNLFTKRGELTASSNLTSWRVYQNTSLDSLTPYRTLTPVSSAKVFWQTVRVGCRKVKIPHQTIGPPLDQNLSSGGIRSRPLLTQQRIGNSIFGDTFFHAPQNGFLNNPRPRNHRQNENGLFSSDSWVIQKTVFLFLCMEKIDRCRAYIRFDDSQLRVDGRVRSSVVFRLN